MGGFQLDFVGTSRVINHMASYNLSALIGGNCSIQTEEQILQRIFLQIHFPPIRALEFIRGHVIFKLCNDQIYQMKTTYMGIGQAVLL